MLLSPSVSICRLRGDGNLVAASERPHGMADDWSHHCSIIYLPILEPLVPQEVFVRSSVWSISVFILHPSPW